MVGDQYGDFSRKLTYFSGEGWIMFTLKSSKLAGCYEVQPKVFEDQRGRFVKVFHEPSFAAQGLCRFFYRRILFGIT